MWSFVAFEKYGFLINCLKNQLLHSEYMFLNANSYIISIQLNSNRLFKYPNMSDNTREGSNRTHGEGKSRRNEDSTDKESENQTVQSQHVTQRQRTQQTSTNDRDGRIRSTSERSAQPSQSIKKDAESGQNPNQLKYVYTIAGQSKKRYITQELLIERLNKINEPKAPILQKESQEEKSSPQQDDKQITCRRRHRYFDQLLSGQPHRKVTKCYRCGKVGHISATCLEEKNKIKCYYCLRNHHWNKCQYSVICNRCGDAGHIQKECSTKKILRCDRCKKKGHLQKNCGTIIFQKIEKNVEYRYHEYPLDKVEESDLENLRCMDYCSKPYRHFSCYKIDLEKQTFYRRDKNKYERQSEQGKNEQECLDITEALEY